MYSSTVSVKPSERNRLAMPTTGVAHDACLWALPEFQGEVSVLGADVMGDVRIATADVRTAPGTPAWSPPI